MPRPWILDATAPPLRRVTLTTPHELTTVRTAIRTLLHPDGEFHGTLDGDRVQLVRRAMYRNGFLPIFRGELRPSVTGVDVQLTARPAILTICSWSLWMAFALGAFALTLADLLRHGREPGGVLGALLLVAFGWLLASLGFGLEARYGVRLIAEAIGAEP